MMDGAPMMPRLSVDNLATPLMVRHGSDQSLHFGGRMLTLFICGHPGVQYFSSAYFGQGIGSIFLDNVACSGSETSLISCSYTTPTSSDSHSEDAGVRCPGKQYFMLYLDYEFTRVVTKHYISTIKMDFLFH